MNPKNCQSLQELEELKEIESEESESYSIIKYPHPDAKLSPSFVQTADSLAEAKEICSSPESFFQEGETKNWYFLGFIKD